MPVDWKAIEPLLMQAEKPARYVGGEFNQVIKASARARCCLAFPDLYDVGMSYHGYRILYERINAREGWAAERTYAPWGDFERLMRRDGVPLYSLETRRTLCEFEWVGFTLQHEVNTTNVLNMIDLAGLALESKDRTDPFPILIGGGEGASAPEPLAPFLDAFVVGDGEEIVLELMALFERARAARWTREQILRALAATPGVYVPSFYEVAYHEDGRVAAVRPSRAIADNPAPAIVQRRRFDLAADGGPTRPVVPLLRTVHDRLVVEIRRGCVNGCRFCHAGMINRPVRERPPGQIVEAVREGLLSTGYATVSLLSLSSADYTMIGPLTRALGAEFGAQGVSLSLPSLRINGFDVELIEAISRGRRSGFTFAPEAGSERLRRVINKPVDQEFFFSLIADVFRRGWQTIKFYFMIGLPSETDEDLDGIAQICARAAELGGHTHRKRATINVTLSPFVPKSNTPFQWEGQPPREELERRYRYVRQAIERRAGRCVDVKTADLGLALVEAVLARGDRRVGAAVRRAWELGARFDGWDESFNVNLWLQAFAETGIDPAFYANRKRGEDEVFPHEHIASGVSRQFLWADRQRALGARVMEKCDTSPCSGCEVCDEQSGHTLAQDMAGENDQRDDSTAAQPRRDERNELAQEPGRAIRFGEAAHASPLPVQRLRLTHTKLGALRYLSHLDFGRILSMILRRAELPLALTQGFNPTPRVQFAPPLSLGMGGTREFLDLMLIGRVTAPWALEALRNIPLAGCDCLAIEEVPLKSDSLEQSILASIYELEFVNQEPPIAPQRLEEAVLHFEQTPEWIVEVQKKNGARRIDLKQSIHAIELTGESADAQRGLRLAIRHASGYFVKPHEAAGFLLGRGLALGGDVRINRVGFHLRS